MAAGQRLPQIDGSVVGHSQLDRTHWCVVETNHQINAQPHSKAQAQQPELEGSGEAHGPTGANGSVRRCDLRVQGRRRGGRRRRSSDDCRKEEVPDRLQPRV